MQWMRSWDFNKFFTLSLSKQNQKNKQNMAKLTSPSYRVAGSPGAVLLCVSGQLGWEMVKLCLLTNSLFPGDTVHNWQFKRHFENCSASFVSTFASSLQSSNIRQRAKRIFSKRNWEFRMQQQTCPVEELLKKVCSKYFLFLSTVEYVVIQTRLGWPWQGQVQPSVECSGQLYTGQLWREEGTIMLGMDRQAG